MGASLNLWSSPASKPSPSQITWAVDSGKMEAAKSDALSSPKANRIPAPFPASGISAAAACAGLPVLARPHFLFHESRLKVKKLPRGNRGPDQPRQHK